MLLSISEISHDVDSPPLVPGEVYNGGDDVVLVKPPSAVEVSNVNGAEFVAVDRSELKRELEVEDISDGAELEVERGGDTVGRTAVDELEAGKGPAK